MAVRKKIRPGKNTGPTSRVHKITSLAQWESMLRKAGSRLVVAQFFQSANWTCKQMRPYFTRFSTNGQFRKIIFVEVDVDEADEVAKAAHVSRIPTYQFYFEEELVETYSGGVVNQLQQLLKDTLREYNTSSPLVTVVKAVAALSTLALGSFFALRHFKKSDVSRRSSDNDLSAELIDLKRRIAAARSKLSAFEKAHRSKQARAQRKLVEQMEAKRRLLERSQRSSSGAPAEGHSRRGGRSHRGHRDVDEDEDWPVPPPGPKCVRRLQEAVYSDEEEEVQRRWERAVAN